MSGREAILRVEVSHRLPQSRFDFDLAFAARGTGLFGANGVGKTTLLDFISGVKQPERGQIKSGQAIWFDSDRNRNLAQHKRRVARVFQDGRLMPHLTVEQNLNFAARGAGRSSVFSADRALIEEELKLEHLFDQRPGQLSGGEKQRVALARVLLSDTPIIILDEFSSALDAQLEGQLFASLREALVGKTVVLITHRESALQLTDRVVQLPVPEAHGAP